MSTPKIACVTVKGGNLHRRTTTSASIPSSPHHRLTRPLETARPQGRRQLGLSHEVMGSESTTRLDPVQRWPWRPWADGWLPVVRRAATSTASAEPKGTTRFCGVDQGDDGEAASPDMASPGQI
uniref:Uncharacterized protein n=1 Tax=Oryza glumipatula TaxID=40148 RepID=A0A0E0A9B2_9ORYZ